jgi:hypothetical protein
MTEQSLRWAPRPTTVLTGGLLIGARRPPYWKCLVNSSCPGQPFALSFLEAKGFVRCLPRFVVQQNVGGEFGAAQIVAKAFGGVEFRSGADARVINLERSALGTHAASQRR